MRRASSASKAGLSTPGVRASTKSPGIGTTFDRPTLPPSTDHSDCVGAAVGMSNARPFLRLGKDQGPPQLIDRDRPLSSGPAQMVSRKVSTACHGCHGRFRALKFYAFLLTARWLRRWPQSLANLDRMKLHRDWPFLARLRARFPPS